MNSFENKFALQVLIDALAFSAEKHKYQRRKGSLKIPYINHPIKVCQLLIKCGETDLTILTAALLHDVLEDTDTTYQEIEDQFGKEVALIVQEVTDDMQLPKRIRKKLQIENAPFLSTPAKLIKIADKACNMYDLINYPIYWTKKRKRAYFEWSKQVFDSCKNINNQLDEHFNEVYQIGMKFLK